MGRVNAQNLRPPYSPEEAREMGRAGGIASGASKRRRKGLRQLALDVMGSGLEPRMAAQVAASADGLGPEDLTVGAGMVAVQASKALKGDVRSFKALAELAGDGEGEEERGRPFVADYCLEIADPFVPLHREVAAGAGCDFWIKGGRASAKSSYVSLEVVGLLMRDPSLSALVMVKRQSDIRDSVWEQVLWAMGRLGVADEWAGTTRPYKLTRRSTGQVILFRGCDKAAKSKGLKAPGDTYFGVQWFEEVDQFSGMAEVRTVYQSATRGAPEGSPFYRFHTYNPPRAKDSWANREADRRVAAGMLVVTSNYTDLPPGWLPEQTLADALALKEADEEAYRHEWLGDAVGFGAEVFPRTQVRPLTEAEAEELEGAPRCYGVDWGFSADPWAWVECAYVRRTRTLYVLRELSGRGLSNPETAAMVAAAMEREPYATVVCDSAEPKSVADYRNEGIRAVKAPKSGANDVRNSVKWLQYRTAIVVDPSCTLAADEFKRYAYELTPDGEPTGSLPDRDNHAIDAVRYACSTLIADRTAV